MSMKLYYVYVTILIATFDKSLAIGSKCPKPELISPCRCLMKREERQVWCSHSDLPKVLSGLRSLSKHLTSPIDELILENNYLPSLPGRTFANLKVLRIMLRQNGLERVSHDWLHGLEDVLMELFIVEPKLRYLPEDSLSRMNALEAITFQVKELKRLPQISSLAKLRYVQIESEALTELSPMNFKNLPILEKIHMSRSKNLKRLEAGLFEDLPRLNSINMSHCGIFWVHPRAFSNLPEVRKLSLEHNQIQDAGMVGRACKDLHSLKDLNLDHNNIDELSKGSFVDLPALQHLQISFNNISEIHQGAFLRVPRLKDLHLNNNKLKKIHPESFIHSSDSGLEEMWIVNNHISQISELRSLLISLPRLLYLDMSFNKLEVIPFGSLRGHPTLEVIKLNSNRIKHIDRESFMAMPALRELSLRNNSLSNNGGPLWNLPSLKGLDLSGNYFRKLESLFLSNLPSLRRLDVSDNEVVIVDPLALSSNPFIEYVNLSDNNLQFIHQATFKHSEKLYELDVSHNRLEEFQVDLPQGLEYLHLNFNKLRVFPSFSGITKYSLRHLDLSYNLMNKLNALNLKKLQSLTKLYMTNNFIQRLDEGVLEGLSKLEMLDLSANKIFSVHQDALKNLHNLMELNLKSNSIESLYTVTLQKAPKLSKLDVSKNKLVDFLQGSLEFNSNLKHLNISHNYLVELPRNIFKMKQLTVLDVSYNRIKYLPVEAFSRLGELMDLRISDNFVRELRLSTFSRLRNLRVVYLDHNDIDKMETNTFHSLPSLEMIKLDNNKLSRIPSYTFNNLTMLQVAELQGNTLEMVASDAFNMVPNLMFLNLSGNEIGNVEDSGLRNVPSLEVLDLSDNAIRRLDSDSFKRMKWMVEIRLDGNYICEILGKPFSDMPRLRVISLRGNRLKRVHEKILERIRTNIAVFDVDENPLQCDCNALWLKVWAEESSLMGPHCSNGNLVRELKLSPVYCKQKPMKETPIDCNDDPNRFSQVFSKYSNLRNISGEEKANILAPLPQESEYFYDEYVDYPFNESQPLVSNTDEGVLDRFLKVNHSSLSEPQASFHDIPGDTPTLYAAPSADKTRPDIPKEVPHSPSSSGFTFFGVPLPSISLGQILGGNKNSAAKSAHATRATVPVADRKVAIMNVPVLRGTTARNVYRLPSTPFVEMGGFRPMLPGEGGFRPITTTIITDARTEVEPETSTITPYPAGVTSSKGRFQEISEDSTNLASSPVIRKTTHPVLPTESSSTQGWVQESTTYSPTDRAPTYFSTTHTQDFTVPNIETPLVLNSTTPNALVVKNQLVNSTNFETKLSEADNATIFSKTGEDDGTTQTVIGGKGTQGLVTKIEVSEEDAERIKTEKPIFVTESSGPLPTETTTPVHSSTSSTTDLPTNISIRRNSSEFSNGAFKTKTKGLTLDQIAKVTNATNTPRPMVPMPTLLIPGGQQPHTRSSGRSTITKVLSPFTTGASPLIRGTQVQETGDTVTLDPLITKLDEAKESWYFANYNKTYSEPYLGVRPNGGLKIGVPCFSLLFLMSGVILFGNL